MYQSNLDYALGLTHLIKISTSDDVLGVVLRTHLHQEKYINFLIDETLGSDVFKGVNLNHASKLTIARNIGLKKPYYDFFKKINSIRNELSHGKFDDLQDKHIADLENITKQSIDKISFDDLYRINLAPSSPDFNINKLTNKNKYAVLFLVMFRSAIKHDDHSLNTGSSS